MRVRPLQDADRGWVHDLIAREWGLPVVSISGVYDDPSLLPGFVAESDAEPLGVLTYRLAADECEVVTLNSLLRRRGVGSALMAAVKELADRERCRLWLITTNENVDAIAFYQRLGMDLAGLHRDFVEQVRRHKVLDPAVDSGIAFKHAIEFSY